MVVENDSGFALGVAIICHEDLPRISFYRVIIEADVVATYVVDEILASPFKKNIVARAFVRNQICYSKPNAFPIEFV